MPTASKTGGCLCGGVRFEIVGPLREVVNCHCGQCRKFHGHYAPYSAAPREQVLFVAKTTLKWFETTPGEVRRGFCHVCGASLFWDRYDRPTLSVIAGSLDKPTGLKTTQHIYTEEAGDYYSLADDLQKLPGSMY